MSREDKLKAISLKQEALKGRNHLASKKDKYYNELKFNSKNAPEEYKEAVDFYDDFKKSQAQQQQISSQIEVQHQDFFSKDFQDGFVFNVGSKKYKYKDSAESVQKAQTNLNSVVSGFVGDDGLLKDPEHYHKSLYALRNPDALAKHFYEQGRSDAIKDNAKQSSNIDMKANSNKVKPSSSGTKVEWKLPQNPDNNW